MLYAPLALPPAAGERAGDVDTGLLSSSHGEARLPALLPPSSRAAALATRGFTRQVVHLQVDDFALTAPLRPCARAPQDVCHPHSHARPKSVAQAQTQLAFLNRCWRSALGFFRGAPGKAVEARISNGGRAHENRYWTRTMALRFTIVVAVAAAAAAFVAVSSLATAQWLDDGESAWAGPAPRPRRLCTRNPAYIADPSVWQSTGFLSGPTDRWCLMYRQVCVHRGTLVVFDPKVRPEPPVRCSPSGLCWHPAAVPSVTALPCPVWHLAPAVVRGIPGQLGRPWLGRGLPLGEQRPGYRAGGCRGTCQRAGRRACRAAAGTLVCHGCLCSAAWTAASCRPRHSARDTHPT